MRGLSTHGPGPGPAPSVLLCFATDVPDKRMIRRLFEHTPRALGAVLLISAAFLVYANSLRNPYLWDDADQIGTNYALGDPTNLPRLFSARYYDLSREESYRPLKILSFLVAEPILGSSPRVQRALNVGLHAADCVLVYRLAEAWIGPESSLFAAMLFALHPVHSETIDCVSYRDELLACLFFLLACLCLEDVRPKTALAMFGLALLSKENSIVLPAVVLGKYLMLDAKVEQKDAQRTFLAGAIPLAGCYLILRLAVLPNADRSAVYPGGSLYTNLLTMLPAALHYLRLLAWPAPLSVAYDLPVLRSALDFRFWGPLLILAAGAAGCRWIYRRNKMGAFLAFWTCASLLPVLNLVPFLRQSLMFERYLYLPSVGFCLLAALALSRLPRRVFAPLGLAILGGCAWRTVRRNVDWRSPERLYGEAVRLYPRKYSLYVFLGKTSMEKGDLDEAASYFRKSLEIEPDYENAHDALGALFFKKGDYARAIGEFQAALKSRPGYLEARNNLAVAYFESGQERAAEESCRLAMLLRPENAQAYENLALFYIRENKPDQSIRTAEDALSRGMRSPALHADLGMALSAEGRFDRAIAQFQAAVALDPRDAALQDYLGVAYAGAHRLDAAVAEFQKALALNARFAPAHRNLAGAYLQLGRRGEALAEIDAFLRDSADEKDKQVMRTLRSSISAGR